jgi:RyR domain
MEAIIDMSQLAGNSSFQRSSLPSQAQLDLHIDGPRFLALVHRLDLTGDLLEQLAATAHDVYCEDLEGRGYQPGPARNETRKISPSLRPYTELPEEDREQNRASVRDIPAKLAKAGYRHPPLKQPPVPLAAARERAHQDTLTPQERVRGTGRAAISRSSSRRHGSGPGYHPAHDVAG